LRVETITAVAGIKVRFLQIFREKPSKSRNSTKANRKMII
jgi:hypothetical protein